MLHYVARIQFVDKDRGSGSTAAVFDAYAVVLYFIGADGIIGGGRSRNGQCGRSGDEQSLEGCQYVTLLIRLDSKGRNGL